MSQLDIIHGKILRRDALLKTLHHRHFGDWVVFTNGCFDLLHRGHVTYLSQARDLGCLLVVGLNSDASVRRLKGPDRPLVDQDSRALLLASLQCVDYVTIFDEDTPYELIKAVMPDVLVKGGDYRPHSIVGADIVHKHGGQVRTIPLVEGFSTTRLAEKLRHGK